MSDHLAEMLRVIVPAVVIPAAVFCGNWAVRYKEEYTQTAASDFILAMLIFDGAVVTTAKDFEPFIQNPDLKQIVLYWHVCLGIAGMGLWWLIATFGEPVVAGFYTRRETGQLTFFLTLAICWVAVFILISVHISFFFWHGGPP